MTTVEVGIGWRGECNESWIRVTSIDRCEEPNNDAVDSERMRERERERSSWIGCDGWGEELHGESENA